MVDRKFKTEGVSLVNRGLISRSFCLRHHWVKIYSLWTSMGFLIGSIWLYTF